MNYYDTLDTNARQRHLAGLKAEAERLRRTIMATVGQECAEAMDAAEGNSQEMADLLAAMRRAGEAAA